MYRCSPKQECFHQQLKLALTAGIEAPQTLIFPYPSESGSFKVHDTMPDAKKIGFDFVSPRHQNTRVTQAQAGAVPATNLV